MHVTSWASRSMGGCIPTLRAPELSKPTLTYKSFCQFGVSAEIIPEVWSLPNSVAFILGCGCSCQYFVRAGNRFILLLKVSLVFSGEASYPWILASWLASLLRIKSVLIYGVNGNNLFLMFLIKAETSTMNYYHIPTNTEYFQYCWYVPFSLKWCNTSFFLFLFLFSWY